MYYSPPRSSVHGILQTRILDWIAVCFPTQGSNPCLRFPALAGSFLATGASWEALCSHNQ